MIMKKLEGALIKVVSLAAGLAIGSVLIAMVVFLMSFDGCFRDVDDIYQIYSGVEREKESKEYNQVSGGVAPGMKEFIPEVEEATRTTFIFDSDKFYDENDNLIKGNLRIADSCFFKIFDREWLVGDWREALCGLTKNVVVSRSFAEKLGGPAAAMGKVISNEQLRDQLLLLFGEGLTGKGTENTINWNTADPGFPSNRRRRFYRAGDGRIQDAGRRKPEWRSSPMSRR